MKANYYLLILVLSIFMSSCKKKEDVQTGFSQELIAALDTKIDSLMIQDSLPGLIIKVVASNNREYIRAKGICNIETGVFRTLTDPYRIASITKTFTASVIHVLINEGKLSTSDKLSKYFPNFPNADIITVRNLLRMRSGIADYGDAAFLEIVYNNPLASYTTQELLQISIDKADEFYKPDSITRYCNVNYTLLGEIAAQIEGKDIGTLIHEKVIEPLGLANTFWPTGTNLPGNNHGYCWDADTKEFKDYTIINPVWLGAGGAMISTLDDMGIFVEALYNGNLWSTAVNTSKNEALQFDKAPDFVKYGEGIEKFGQFWGHNGTVFGFSSEIWYLPEESAIIIINVNRLDLDDHSKSLRTFLLATKTLFPDYCAW